MTIRLTRQADIGEFQRGSAVVCMTAVAVTSELLAGLRSVVGHTDPTTPVLLAGTAAGIERVAAELARETRARTLLGLVAEPDGEVPAISLAIRASLPADVVLVAPGVRVADGWLERLRRAAVSDSTVASATPLSMGKGGIELFGEDGSTGTVSSLRGVPNTALGRARAGDTGWTIDEAATRVAADALHLHPRIAVLGPGCAYIRRSALELAGPLDDALARDEALSDLALRLTALGMVHVLADDVLVTGGAIGKPAGGSSVSSTRLDGAVGETLINDEHSPLRRAIRRAGNALRGFSVTIDGRALTETAGGTQTYIIELVLALARHGEFPLRVLVPPDLSTRASHALASVPEVELLTYEQAIDHPRLTDVVHRPQQVFTPEDLALLRLVGERVVIGQQDLIAYHNQAYHSNVDAWRAYRRTTRLALSGADQVIFFSEHARLDALTEDLLAEGRTHVVGVGGEALELSDVPERRPPGLDGEAPFLLCLGADYAHKNRPFAIALVGALRELGWPGRLVLAGAHVPNGSSREHEHDLLRRSPDLAELTADLGPVDEASRKWLFSHARALVYPTVYEGFGLLPLEAARVDLPCLFAPQASLSELAGAAATLIPWDARASAAAVLALLDPGRARSAHLAQLHALPIPAWSDIARDVVAVYEQSLAAPCSETAPHTWQELDREQYIVRLAEDVTRHKRMAQDLQDSYQALDARVSTGLPLIDRGGGLLSPDQQRGLMRIAGRGRLGALALKPLGPLGRLGGGRSRPAVAEPDLHRDPDGPSGG